MDKDYWRLKKREQRARKKEEGLVKKEAVVDDEDLGTDGEKPEKPEGATAREWEYVLERVRRAKRYAEMMPDFIRPGDLKYQDPYWQWENEVRGRFGGIIGGSLSGSRGQPEGN